MKITSVYIFDDLGLIYLRGRSKFKVAAPLRVTWLCDGKPRRATVPIGSHTNGPSYQSFLKETDDSLIAAAIHDYLASTPASGVGPAEAHALDREIKLAGNVSPTRAWVVWVFLRLFGWIKWHGAEVSTDAQADAGVDGRLDPARGGSR